MELRNVSSSSARRILPRIVMIVAPAVGSRAATTPRTRFHLQEHQGFPPDRRARGPSGGPARRPRPMPLVFALDDLVVKNGSKIRSRISCGMPGPLSFTLSSNMPSSACCGHQNGSAGRGCLHRVLHEIVQCLADAARREAAPRGVPAGDRPEWTRAVAIDLPSSATASPTRLAMDVARRRRCPGGRSHRAGE